MSGLIDGPTLTVGGPWKRKRLERGRGRIPGATLQLRPLSKGPKLMNTRLKDPERVVVLACEGYQLMVRQRRCREPHKYAMLSHSQRRQKMTQWSKCCTHRRSCFDVYP